MDNSDFFFSLFKIYSLVLRAFFSLDKVLLSFSTIVGCFNCVFSSKISSREITFKINVAGKSPGDYFCVLGLKRGDIYIIRGSICVFKIHINLIADDYS